MATPLNVEVLERMGFAIPDDATVNHLVVAVRLDDDGRASTTSAPRSTGRSPTAAAPVAGPSEEAPPRTTAVGPAARRRARWCWSRCPASSAAVEAMDALEAGSDVMVFSDNVPVEQEVALKRYAAARDLLVMGPDCGTAVVGGVGLGFANVVAPGPVGIVAASGTGCQQVLALLDHAGVGVTTAYGVGGRDLSAEVGGLATRTALARLDADPARRARAAGLQATGRRGRRATSRRTPTSLGTPVRLALLGAGPPRPHRRDRGAAARASAATYPTWPVARRDPSPAGHAAARAVRRRHAQGRRPRCWCAAAGVDAELVDFGDDEYTDRAGPTR